MNSLTLAKKLLALSVLSVFFVSCGGSKPMVENVQLSTDQVDGDIYVGLDADLSIGNLKLPITSVPIILPKSGKEIGLLTLAQTLEGKSQLSVDINVSETANLDLSNATLPNGSSLPLIGGRPVIIVPIGKSVEVYISLTADSAALGLSIPIRTFDQLGAKVGTAALMPTFHTNGVFGAAGIYTSKEAGENGFALVADVTSAIGSLVEQKMLDDHSSRLPQLQQDDFDYGSLRPSRRQKRKIDRELYKLHRRKRVLELN